MSPLITPDQGAALRPPGLDAPNLVLPPSVTPQIRTPQAAGAVAGQEVGDIAASMERAALYSGEIEKHFKAIRDQTKEMHRSTADTVREVREGFQNPGYRDSPASSGHVRRHTAGPEGGAPGGGGHGDRFRDMDFGQGRDIGENISDLRANVARRTNRWMSEWGAKYRPDTNEAGQYVDEAGRATREAARMGADWERGMSRIGRVQGVVNAVGEGQGLSGMLGKVGGRFAGPIGVAVGAGMALNNQMISQRRQNAFYKNIYGGSEGDAAKARGQEWLYSHLGDGVLGVMGSDEASQLFRGVSSMGLQGNQRQSALDFATAQYQRTGMDISTSLDLMEAATKNGVQSFSELNGALADVADSAKAGHKSLKEAQEQFVATYKTISGSVSNTSTSGVIAGGLTSLQQGLGHRLGSVDFGGMMGDQRQQMMMAAMLGMNPNEFQLGLQSDPSLAGRGINAVLGRIGSTALDAGTKAATQGTYDRLRRAGGGKMSEDAWGELGREMLSYGGNSLARYQAMAQAMGLNLTQAQVAEFAARQEFGDPSMNAEEKMGAAHGGFSANEANQVKGIDLRKGGGNRFSGASAGQDQDLARELGIKGHSWAWQDWAGGSDKATDAYFDSLHEKGGKRYKSIEELLRNGGVGDDTKIRVKDKSGKDVDVTLAQAIKYHKDELESGNLQITAGKDAGKTVGEVTGVYAKPDPKKTETKAKITLEAKGTLKQFIEMQVSGGASVDTARRSGQPASAFSLAPWALPSGSDD